MATTHIQVSWTAGDDWQINATLLDDHDVPFNLTGATIRWALMNSAYQRALDEGDVSIAIVDAVAGKCAIHVPAAKTSPLLGGRYSDIIRIVIGGITSTLSYGLIQVAADPWVAQQVVVAPAVMTVQRDYKLHAVAA